jgi:hypothetical protein
MHSKWQREVFGGADTTVLVRWLEEELEAKGRSAKGIGFLSARL